MKRYLVPASRLALSIDLRPRQAKEKCLFVAPFTSSLLRGVEYLGIAKSLIFDRV